MTSFYDVRIYELLVQHRVIGNGMFHLKDLHETLQIVSDEYKLTVDFIHKVIEVTVDQINKYSNLIVKYKFKKTDRTITNFFSKSRKKTPSRNGRADRPADPGTTGGREEQRIDDPIEEF